MAAENLFLRKQLALFQEREIKPRRADDATRVAMVWLRALIRQMASENPNWGEERIANELLLKLGLQVSARTVRKYMPELSGGGPTRRVLDQRWTTFVRNHAEAVVACDFFTVVSATFKVLYVFIVVEHATRRLLRFNVTQHPTADWTRQQLREVIPGDHPYRFLIRDRDAKFSPRLDESIRRLGLHLPAALQPNRHELPLGTRVAARSFLGGLHHEYLLSLAA